VTDWIKLAEPLVVSDGMGVDSTAMLLGLAERRIRPDAVIFADVGSEWPETYEAFAERNALLDALGFPRLTVVRYQPKRPKNGPFTTLEEQCLVNRSLPSLAFGRKKCSQLWKAEPIDKWVRERFADHIAAGGTVSRALGYEAGPREARRGYKPCGGIAATDDPAWRWVYPLREWGWDREACQAKLAEYSLVIHKSACFFCPAAKPYEVRELAERYPDLAARAVAIEDAGRPYARAVTGLWRRPCKGTRGAEAHPGTWRGYLEEQGLLPAEDLITRYRTRCPSSKPEQPEEQAA
jgi:hypothetical protein